MTAAPPASDLAIATPRARSVLRRALFWIVASVVALLVGLVSLLMVSGAASGETLGADDATPVGGKALASVLADRGVRVVATSSMAETRDVVDDPARTTIVLYDEFDAVGAIADELPAASEIVLIDPASTALDALAPTVLHAGVAEADADDTVATACALPAAVRAEEVSGGGMTYRVQSDESGQAVTCVPSGDDSYGLVRVTHDASAVTVLGNVALLQNGTITSRGNAALALGLLGSQPNLVWYLPGPEDLADDAPSLGELTPDWVTPVALLALLAVLAAGVWCGRRFGPLVVEQMPVVVRSTETMEGRARLYALGSSRLHALDSLRVGTISRLAALLGLPRSASVDEVVAGTAALLGGNVGGIRDLLVDATPTGDRDLIALSDELARLEAAVTTAIRP